MKKLLFVSLLVLLGLQKLQAQPSALDPGFATNGIGKYDIPLYKESAIGQFSFAQADGKIFTGFYCNNILVITKLNADGSTDNSYGINGKSFIYNTEASAIYYDAIMQADGKIVLAGGSNRHCYVTRINTDGTIDKTFGTSGSTAVNISEDFDVAYAIALQSDGKIVIAGYGRDINYHRYFVTARLTTDGTLDNSFDTDGKKQFSMGAGARDDIANAVAIGADGKIIIGGSSRNATDVTKMAIARLNNNGSFDDTFNGSGRLIYNFFDGNETN